MSLSSKDSIFECTGSPVVDFTLSCLEEGDSAQKLSIDSINEEGTKQLITEEHVCSVKLTDLLELNDSSDRSLPVFRACIRHDIMEQVSSIMSELVGIDLKYSELAQISAPQGKDLVKKPVQNPVPVDDGRKRTPLESLHAYTISELHSQLSALRVFIHDLDVKYSEVARCFQERIKKLEQCKTELSSEVERLRRFY